MGIIGARSMTVDRRLAGMWLAAFAMAVAAAGASHGPVVHAASASPPLQGEDVRWIGASPDYSRTGVVLAMGTEWQQGCTSQCNRLWITRNGGSSWQPLGAAGWDQGQPVMAQDASSHVILYAEGHTALQRSDDFGATWTNIGATGVATPAPSYPRDGTVAIAGPRDYVLQAGHTTPVQGSGGQYTDFSFMYAPTFPSGGSHAPALLSTIDAHAQIPIIQQCDAHLTCTGTTTLAGTARYALPVTLLPSTDYANDGVVFAQSMQGIYKSIDGGQTFTVLSVGPPPVSGPPATPEMVLAPGYREHGSLRTAFVAVIGTTGSSKSPQPAGGVYRTDDGGATWRSMGSPSILDSGATAVALAPDGRLFGAYLKSTNSGLMCMSDGKTWQASCPPTAANTGSNASTAPSAHPAGCSGCRGSTAGSGVLGEQKTGSTPVAARGESDAGVALAPGSGKGGGGGRGAVPLVGALVAGVLLLLAGISGLVRWRRVRAG
jgi:hypothetical protein